MEADDGGGNNFDWDLENIEHFVINISAARETNQTKITTHTVLLVKVSSLRSCLSAISGEHHWHSPVSKPDAYASIVDATPQVNFDHQPFKLWKVNQEEGSPEKELRKHMGHLLTCCQFWKWYTSPDLLFNWDAASMARPQLSKRCCGT